VLAPTQRRRFPYYFSLPLVVAIVLLLVAKLVALQRADILAALGDRIAHSDSADAAAAVRQLTAMPRAPVSILVSAATSADREVADEAKLCIGRLLRRAQRQIDAGRRVGPVARQLAELAASLDAQQAMFSSADYGWLSSTTRKVLRLANRIPPGQTPLVAVHCDAILAGLAAKEPLKTEIAENEPDVDEPFIGEGAMIDDGEQPATATVSGRATPSDASQKVSGEELPSAPWRTSWSHPIFRTAPARPINAPPVGAASRATLEGETSPPRQGGPTPQSPPTDPDAAKPPLAGAPSRELLRRWLDAEGSEVFPLEVELTRRGFGRLSARLVEPLFSADLEDRLALVDDVLTEPGVDARPWLMLLSDDANADVRLLTVTIMATSNDAELVEKAWQVAIRDQDPRIAGLAGRLRERRTSTQRR
jgi:hypothetical protein